MQLYIQKPMWPKLLNGSQQQAKAFLAHKRPCSNALKGSAQWPERPVVLVAIRLVAVRVGCRRWRLQGRHRRRLLAPSPRWRRHCRRSRRRCRLWLLRLRHCRRCLSRWLPPLLLLSRWPRWLIKRPGSCIATGSSSCGSGSGPCWLAAVFQRCLLPQRTADGLQGALCQRLHRRMRACCRLWCRHVVSHVLGWNLNRR